MPPFIITNDSHGEISILLPNNNTVVTHNKRHDSSVDFIISDVGFTPDTGALNANRNALFERTDDAAIIISTFHILASRKSQVASSYLVK